MIRIGSVGTEPEPRSQWTWPDMPRPRSSRENAVSVSPPVVKATPAAKIKG